jgi:Zn-finger nucleic acid-binding protein
MLPFAGDCCAQLAAIWSNQRYFLKPQFFAGGVKMADDRDRLGRMLQQAEKAREDQWARQRDEEILQRLREKYARHINCPICATQLDPRATLGLGGMACPGNHGAWADTEALERLRARLRNAAAIHHEGLGEKVFAAVGEVVEGLRHKHPAGLHCPECAAILDPRAEGGLGGMACPNRHGVWLDRDTLEQIRTRLNEAHGVAPKTVE